MSISDCNSLTGSAICGRLIFAALVKSNDYGVLSADKAKNNWLLTSASVSISAFKEHLPNALSPPTKKDFARLGLDTRKFLNEKNLSDLMKITAVSDQKQFRTALRKSMNAEDMSLGEQAKLELLFQSISLEKLEQISKKLNDDFKVKFNKPKVTKRVNNTFTSLIDFSSDLGKLQLKIIFRELKQIHFTLTKRRLILWSHNKC